MRYFSRSMLVIALASLAIAGAAQEVVLPDLPDTEVELSWTDFKRLVEAAGPSPAPVPAPPRDAFLRSAEYHGRLEPGVLLLEGTVVLEVLKEGWVRLPLWAQANAVTGFDGGGALLARQGSGVEVVAQGPGRYTMRVELAVAAPDNPGENRLALIFPDAPLNLLEVVAGEGVDELRAESGLVVDSGGRATRFALNGGSATLTWRRPFTRDVEAGDEEVEREPRVHVVAYELLDVGEGALGGLLVLDYRVRVAGVGHFDLVIPDGVEVFDVGAPGLEAWKVLRRDDSRVLHVGLVTPVEGEARVVVSFEGTYDPDVGRLEVPRFEPLAVEREAGFVAVSAEGAEVDLSLGEGVLPADPSEIPADVQAFGGNAVVACKYSGAPGTVVVAVTEHADAAVLTAIIERLNATTVVLEDGTEALWLDLAVKNNRKQFLKLALPEGDVEIWSLLVDGDPARPKRSDETVLVPLPRGGEETTASVSLVMLSQGRRVRAFRRTEPALPRFDTPVAEAMWTVYLPANRRYRVLRSSFSVVAETAAVVRSRGGGVGWMAGVAQSVDDYAAAPVSSETIVKQKMQEEQAFKQLKVRQGAVRRGALPVRIALPQGVTTLPKVAVARILMVEDAPVRLPILVYPGWISALLKSVEVLAIAAAAFLLGLWRRDRPWLLAGAVLAALVGLIVPGGPGVVGTVFLVAFLAALLRGFLTLRTWWLGRRQKKEPGVGSGEGGES